MKDKFKYIEINYMLIYKEDDVELDKEEADKLLDEILDVIEKYDCKCGSSISFVDDEDL